MDFLRRTLDRWRHGRQQHRLELEARLLEAGQAVLARLAEQKRTAWTPTLEDGAGEAAASRFGGTPWLPAGTQWPPCGACRQPATFLAQVDLDPLPAQARTGRGLLQVFYCTACERRGEQGWGPHAPIQYLRIVPNGEGQAAAPPHGVEVFPARRVVAWTAADDYPGFDDIVLPLSDEESDALANLGFPLPGEKLRGWAATTQTPLVVRCRRCDAELDHLLQIDSYIALPLMWGDAGIAHVLQCAAHPDELAFYWDCT